MKKQLLLILSLAALSLGTNMEARRNGGSCTPCAKSSCEKSCGKLCPIKAACAEGVCIDAPGADCWKPCNVQRCTVKRVPVEVYRNVKECYTQVAGPVCVRCPETDKAMAIQGEADMADEIPAPEQPAKRTIRRGLMRRKAAVQPTE